MTRLAARDSCPAKLPARLLCLLWLGPSAGTLGPGSRPSPLSSSTHPLTGPAVGLSAVYGSAAPLVSEVEDEPSAPTPAPERSWACVWKAAAALAKPVARNTPLAHDARPPLAAVPLAISSRRSELVWRRARMARRRCSHSFWSRPWYTRGRSDTSGAASGASDPPSRCPRSASSLICLTASSTWSGRAHTCARVDAGAVASPPRPCSSSSSPRPCSRAACPDTWRCSRCRAGCAAAVAVAVVVEARRACVEPK